MIIEAILGSAELRYQAKTNGYRWDNNLHVWWKNIAPEYLEFEIKKVLFSVKVRETGETYHREAVKAKD